MSAKVHWLESFCLQDVYPKYGLVWQVACTKIIPMEKDDILVSTNLNEVTCKRCLFYTEEERLKS